MNPKDIAIGKYDYIAVVNGVFKKVIPYNLQEETVMLSGEPVTTYKVGCVGNNAFDDYDLSPEDILGAVH